MATNDRLLIAQLDVSIRSLERSMKKAGIHVDNATQQMEKRWERMNRRVTQQSNQMATDVRRAIAGIAIGMAGREVLQYEETWRNATNTMAQYADVMGDAGQATSALNSVANDAGVPMAALGNLTGAAARAARDLGKSRTDVLQFAESVSKGSAIANNGAAAVDGAMIQLAQAIASPRVQLQEFNSIIEGTPRLAQAFADGVDGAGGSIAKLRQQIADGEVSGQELFDALLSQTEKLRAEFDKVQQGPVQAVARLNNKLAEYVGTNDLAVGSAQKLAGAIEFVADNVDVFAEALVIAGAALAGAFGASAAVSVVKGLADITKGTQGAARAMALLRAASAFMFGPAGIILGVGAAAAAFAYFAIQGDDAADAIGNVETALKRYETTAQRIKSDTERLAELNNQLREAIANQQPVIEATARADIAAISSRIAKNRELQQVLAVTAKAELARAKTEQSQLVAPRLFRPGLDDLASNQERQQYGMFVIEGVGAEEIARRRSEYEQDVIDAIEKELAETGRVSDKQQEVLDFVAKRAELTAQIAALEEQVNATVGDTVKLGSVPGFGAGGGGDMRPDQPGSGSVIDKKAIDEAVKTIEALKASLASAEQAGEKGAASELQTKIAVAERTLELLKSGVDKATAQSVAGGEFKDKPETDKMREDALRTLEAIQDAYRQTFETERQEIQRTLTEQLAAIDKAKASEEEKAQARRWAIATAKQQTKEVAEEEAKLAEEEKERTKDQAAREIGLLQQVEAARDQMAGRAFALLAQEYDQREEYIRQEIEDETRKQEALAALAEERRLAEADLEKRALGEGEYSKNPIDQIRAQQEEELALLEEWYAEKLDREEEYLERRKEINDEAEAEITAIKQQAAIDQFEAAAQGLDAAADLAKRFAGENKGITKAIFLAEKAAALGSAYVQMNLATAKAAAAAPPPANVPLIAAAKMTGMATIAGIAASTIAGFKDGVIGLRGPGTSRSDSIPAMLSDGESVITKLGTDRNRDVLQMANQGIDVAEAFARAQPLSVVPSFVTAGGRPITIAGSTYQFNGPVDNDTLPQVRAMLQESERNMERAIGQALENDRRWRPRNHDERSLFK